MNINKKAFKDAENENIYTLELYKNSTTGNIEYRSPKGVIIKVADKDGLESLESAVTSLQSAVDALPASPTTTVVNISSAQILNMGSSPIELLPAPGVGKYNHITNVIMEYNYIGSGYTLVDDYYYLENPFYAINNNRLNMGSDKIFTFNLTSDSYSVADDITYNNGGDELNRAFLFKTWSGGNPSGGNSTIRFIITHTTRTFGA